MTVSRLSVSFGKRLEAQNKNRPVLPGEGQVPAVRGKGDNVGADRDRAAPRAGGRVPERSVVRAGSRQDGTVGTEADAGNRLAVVGERALLQSRRGGPQ